MKRTINTFLALFITLSLFAKSGKIVVSGQVQNYSSTTIIITYLNNQKLVSSELDANGNFKMSAKVEDGYYLLKYGRNTAYIYLYPKDHLTLIFDAKDFENTLVFNEKGSARNNYLVKKSKVGSQITKDLESFYSKDYSLYLKNIQKVKKTYISILSEYDVEDFFVIAEKKSLEYERLLSIQNYTSSYKFYLGGEVSPPEDFYAPIKDVDLNNENDYNKQPFYRYLVNSVWSKRIDAAPNVDEMLGILRKVPSKDIAISLINGFYSKISSHKERGKDYLDLIKMVTTHKPFIEAAEKQYNEVLKFQSLKKGNASPGFSYETVDGEIVSLGDLKGKYVYLDIWATWCAPCIKQVPYLKQLETIYHDKNIVFVSISVDKEESKSMWRQMITNEQLGGVQLFADNSFDSEFMDAYAVNSIPRFILIDPEGNIVDSEAPRPSFEETRNLLNRLLE